MSLAYHDGKYVEKSGLTVSIADYGFARGVTAFELMRLYGGVPFRLADHFERFARSAKTLGIPCALGQSEFTAIVMRLAAENKYAHSAIKIYLTAGECAQASALSFAACGGFTPHMVVLEDELRPAHSEAPHGLDFYKRGQKLKIVMHEREMPTVKSTSYALGYYAAREEAGNAWDDILFTRRDGTVTEATRSNFFCVIDGVLCTARHGILCGITRKVVLELAQQIGLAAAERDITPADAMRATEAFTTGSTAEMVPVKQIDSHILPATMDGPVFAQLRRALSAYIEKSRGQMATAS